MARHFYHPERGAWETLTERSAADYPAGTIELPPPPSVTDVWDTQAGAWKPRPAPTAEEIRAQMPPLTVYQLAIAAERLGHITKAEAKGWVKGDLPAKAAAAIGAIPDVAQRFEAEVKAMAPTDIARLSPNIALLASPSGFNLTDEQVDEIFELGSSV